MSHFSSGREAALARRRALSAGKTALPPPAERTRTGFREADLKGEPTPAALLVAAPLSQLSGRQASVARRRMLAGGKAAQPVAPAIEAPAAVADRRGPRLTASRVADGRQVTGGAREATATVSGTQHVLVATGTALASPTKVGQVRTEAGLLVSGTRLRGAVRITGDERGERARITGKADPAPTDDLTPPSAQSRAGATRFRRQFETQAAAGSRQRSLARATETTEAGAAITGSSVGRSLSVTGDEAGACRTISGNQYLTPARRQPACGGEAPAPAASPVKVAESSTWGGRRVTGVDVKPHGHVTGDPPGGADAITGSQYDAPAGTARSAAARRMQAHARLAVTGDAPLPGGGVSGLYRGAALDITGTPYVGEAPSDPAGAFSLPSPPRRRTQGEAADITGSFAVGGGKVTGNVEFTAPPRGRRPEADRLAHARLTGEGRSDGAHVTGDSWAETSRVTGTEGDFAALRNPTERGEAAKAFAGSGVFKTKARHEEARQLVTGMVGYFNKAGARVTLSGGAQS